jgi:CRISPR-associated endonuclease/helicase Cas3
VVFEPEDGSLPYGAYRSATDETRSTLRRGNVDFHDPSLYREYFRRLYQDVDTSANRVQNLRKCFDYPAVAHEFRMIPEETIPVLVPYQEEAKALASEVLKEGVSRRLFRKIQPFVVNIYRSKVDSLIRECLISELSPGLYRWLGTYDEIYGVGKGEADPAALVF